MTARRELLGLVGGAVAVGLAGCTDGTPVAETDDGETAGDTGETDRDTENEPSDDVAFRVRGDVVGTRATGVTVPSDHRPAVEATVAGELGLDSHDVRARESVVEVYADVEPGTLTSALDASSADTSDVEVSHGVSNRTREDVDGVLGDRLAFEGIEGTVSVVGTADDGHAVVVEVTGGADEETVRALLERRGRVAVGTGHPTDDGYDHEELLTQEDFAAVGPVQAGGGSRPPHVPVTLTDGSARRFADALAKRGFTGEGVAACEFDPETDDPPVEDGWCLYTTVDGEVVYAASVGPEFARSLESGEFVDDPRFVMSTATETRARRLRRDLRSGALPAPVENITVE